MNQSGGPDLVAVRGEKRTFTVSVSLGFSVDWYVELSEGRLVASTPTLGQVVEAESERELVEEIQETHSELLEHLLENQELQSFLTGRRVESVFRVKTRPANTPILNEKQILSFMHCGLCLQEVVAGTASPRDYARLEIGWTEQGLQVWCTRHDCNCLHVDFEGQTHPANTTRKA